MTSAIVSSQPSRSEVFDDELVMTSRGPASELMALLDVQFVECAPTRVSDLVVELLSIVSWDRVRRAPTSVHDGRWRPFRLRALCITAIV
jgi:hypothetical protein